MCRHNKDIEQNEKIKNLIEEWIQNINPKGHFKNRTSATNERLNDEYDQELIAIVWADTQTFYAEEITTRKLQVWRRGTYQGLRDRQEVVQLQLLVTDSTVSQLWK